MTRHRTKDKTMLIYASLALAAVAALYLLAGGRHSPTVESPAIQAAPAEAPAVRPQDEFASYDVLPGVASFKDFMQGCLILAETGAGKSSGPYRTAIINLARHRSKPGFLVLAAKKGVYQDWLEYARAAGRSHDVVRFGPGETCDLLMEAMNHPLATVRDGSAVLDHVIDLEKRGKGGGENSYFYDNAARMNQNAIAFIWKSTGSCSIGDVHQLITQAPTTANAADAAEHLAASGLSDKDLKAKSIAAYCLRKAHEKGLEDDDYMLARNYWMHEHRQSSDRQRAAITSILLNLTFQLLSSGMGDIFSSGKTSCGPKRIIDGGAIVILDMPLLVWGEAGRYAQLCMKILLQKHALMRSDRDDPRPVVIAQDEFQLWALPQHDSFVQSVARESRLVSVAATQTISLLRSRMGGESARDEVASLIANHSVKVFGSQSDPEVNAFASSLCGSHWEEVTGGSMQPGAVGYDPIRDMMGQPQPGGPTITWNSHWRPRVDPSVFHRLKRGGDGWVEAMVFQNGRSYPDTGAPFTWTTFDQNFGREEGA